jgi:glycosyltransferase involved in cell wall biosynthesis
MFPLVTVICLVYNHQKFIKKALESVYFQTYPNLEIILVDDASQDQSVAMIEKFLSEIPHYQAVYEANQQNTPTRNIQFIQNKTNQGNCASFNLAFGRSKGKYVIDFATDDVLLDERIAKQVEIFENLPENYGVIFSNALEIDEKDHILKYHFAVNENQKTIEKIPQGDIYQAILEKYFISTPTMLIKRSILEKLNGYDESLSYEDFDFWVRSARICQYFYQDEVTTLKRILPHSHSRAFYQLHHNPHLQSTLKVCEKALLLNQTEAENAALAKCAAYYLRQSFYTQNFDLTADYQALLQKIPNIKIDFFTQLITRLAKWHIPTFWLYQGYRSLAGWLRR